MYALLVNTPLRQLLAAQAPSLIAAFLLAELFYKFGSFALECVAFLATWLVIDAVATGLHNLWLRRGSARQGG
jgi:hypothetical protein